MSQVLDIFRFRRKNTPLHALDPRAKFVMLLALSATSLALNDVLSLVVLLLIEAFLLKLGRSLKEWVQALKGLSLLLAMIFTLNYLTLPSHKLFTSTTMTLRFLCLTTAFSIFFLTTTADELAAALELSGVPREYSIMFTMSLRFVPSLARDLQTISDALKCRGLELEKGGLKERIRNYTYLLVPLIIYELRRSLMVAEALEARGFGAVKEVQPYIELKLKKRDYIAVAASCALISVLAWTLISGAYSSFVRWQQGLFAGL
ncbi:MAG: energy-coupling factor transporter transmembrane component T [Thermofilaceae archaeon]